MKAINPGITRPLQKGSSLVCADNTGAKELQIIAVIGYKGRRKARPNGGIGSVVVCRVVKGTEKVRHEMFRCVIIRQKKEFRRPDGMWVRFEDNAAVIIDDLEAPKGSFIKGPVAREAVHRFSTISKVASIVA